LEIASTIAVYTFILNSTKLVFVYASSHLINVITFPNPITWVCKGNFLDTESKSSLSMHEDVLFAAECGGIFSIDNDFKPKLYFNHKQTITQILPYTPRNLPETSSPILVVKGLSSSVYFYYNQLLIQTLNLPDWVTKIVTGDLCNNYGFANFTSESSNMSSQPIKITVGSQRHSAYRPVKEFKGPDIAFALDDATVVVYSGAALTS